MTPPMSPTGTTNTVGVVLAAGTSRRLRPYSDGLPKTLVPLPGDTTPLDIILGNFAHSGITDVAVVVGYAADAIRKRQYDLERRHNVTLELVQNDHAETWNNCYSLWCARHLFPSGVVLSNGDTVHPSDVENALLTSSVAAPVVLAVDTVKKLGDEEMKVTLSDSGGVEQIHKSLDPGTAYGEYIGVALIRPEVADALAAALEATWRRDPGLYYEDGFAELIRRSASAAGEAAAVGAQPIGDQRWVEIDDHADLVRAADMLKAGTNP